MDIDSIAKALKELGHPTRLAIFQRLVKSGTNGLPVGVIQEQLNIPASTLSHHISGLVSAQLIKQRRESRTLYCVVEYQRLKQVLGFLQDECCADEQAATK
ncbi:metalloregulator ArsR/SmtB family transcription factor [Thalassotalea sp. G2M2-11]|uniref:ArsR/SmtB family transcription factor n=1 Tax=Thalassotalea sp. G2M2-11 TaxID=2787627 RepID=UPI0019D112C7|nr:metalloregulator ArsR/SmtB family transcription factor [Thalassotalea sp. G2M2-11]